MGATLGGGGAPLLRAAGRRLGPLTCALSLSGCFMAGPDYVRPSTADLHVPPAWTASLPAGDGDRLAVADWWQHLGDAQLTSLVARAVVASPDVAAARARLREARAQRGVTGADLWPSVNLGASGQYVDTSASSGNGDGQDLYSAGFDASWEPDLFGGKRRALEAASADVEAAAASLRDVHVTLAAETARNYVELRSDQARIVIARANLASQSETLDLTRWRVQAGLATSVDFEQASTNVEQTRAAIPALETSRAEAEHRLATLLGAAPGALAEELAATAPIPQIPEPLTTGIPADVLRQRPDVIAAERTLAAQTARVGEATAARYPSLSLSGSLGPEALAIGALTSGSSIAAGVAGSLTQSIFDAGRIAAQIEVRDAIQAEALAAYRATVLTALEDVENALVALAKTRERAAALARGVGSARNAAQLARQRYAAGLIDFQTVLDTERTVLTIEESLTTAEANGTIAAIQLYKALGGGWPATSDPVSGDTSEVAS